MTTATATPKADVVPPTERVEQLVVVRKDTTISFLERWIDGPEPDKALARVDAMTKMLERLRLAAIQQTYPTDWVIHSTLKDGVVVSQVGYCQDSGCERAGKVFGIVIGEPDVEREDLPDGTYVYNLQAEAISNVTHEKIETCLGSRWSGDPFFQRQLKEEDDKVDPSDVKKAAYANLHGRAVRALAGMSAVPLEALEAAGIDIKKCRYVGYEQGARGGTSVGASTGGADVTVGFGRSAGKKPGELDDKDLDWYLKTYAENVADEGKAKFKAKNETVLNALRAEKERRGQTAAHDEATGRGPAEGEVTSRGTKVTTLDTMLMDAVKQDRRKVLPLLRAVTHGVLGLEIGSLSEMTEAQLDACLKADAKLLADTAAALDKQAAKK